MTLILVYLLRNMINHLIIKGERFIFQKIDFVELNDQIKHAGVRLTGVFHLLQIAAVFLIVPETAPAHARNQR